MRLFCFPALLAAIFLSATLFPAHVAAQREISRQQDAFPPEYAGQRSGNIYTVMLEDAPLAEFMVQGQARNLQEFHAKRTAMRAKQAQLRAAMAEAKVEVLDATEVVLNAIYVKATREQAEALEKMPGVVRVERQQRLYAHANKALDVNNVRAAWNRVGGPGNAGAGVRIAVLDSGIDQNHPAFANFPAPPPAGYPRCNQASGNCDFTNNKIIAARSYVSLLNFAFGTDPADTRPDDFSPRDRWGHGTAAAMMAAGQEHDTPVGRISGVAPGAFLGNYKVFGTENVNSGTFPFVVIRALEDAIADGMQIATLNLGGPAGYGPNDNFCGPNRNQPCDTFAAGVRGAVRAGLVVVASAGNSGELGPNAPALGTIASPGTTPEAITVGAITNSHIWYNTLTAPGSNLGNINARFTDGPQLALPLEAPMRDAGSVGQDNLACNPLPDNSMAGRMALIQRGQCPIFTKITHAQRAGAIAAVIVNDAGDAVFPFTGLNDTGIPAVLIGRGSGTAVRGLLNVNPNANFRLDPGFREVNAPADEIAIFSSQGPAIGTFGIKPEITAVGTDLYMAAQRNDPGGSMYSPLGYVVADGTSFSAPMVAGAAAILLQRNPGLAPAGVKSLLVQTADPRLTDFDNDGRAVPAGLAAMGAGKLDAARSLDAGIAIAPSTADFGNITSGSFPGGGLVIRNLGSTPANVSTRIERRVPDNNTQITIAPQNFSIAPGGQTQVTISLSGLRPGPGRYEGFLIFSVGGQDLRVPYSYFVGNGVPHNIYALTPRFEGTPGSVREGLLIKVVDQFGVPVANQVVRAEVLSGGGQVELLRPQGAANATTDSFGIVEGDIQIGNAIGQQVFRFTAGNIFADIVVNAFPRPTLAVGGVRDAASGQQSDGFSAGQYISLFGNALANVLKVFQGNELAITLAGASVSFDNPAAQVSVAGRLHFASPEQINVQIPWECEGLPSVFMKVSIGDFSSQVVNLRLRPANPSFFEYTEPVTNRRFIAALDADFRLIGSDNPVPRGGVAQLYVNGLGRVTNRPASGLPSPANPLSATVETPEILIGGQPAQVLFSGLAPGIVGLYQVNVVVPNGAPTGTNTEVRIRAGGVESPVARLAIR
jgi:uncharacterized protein (TIGR03437 family)